MSTLHQRYVDIMLASGLDRHAAMELADTLLHVAPTAAPGERSLGVTQRAVLTAIKAASEAGRRLGMLSLVGSLKINKGGVWRALVSLEERGLIERHTTDGGPTLWQIKAAPVGSGSGCGSVEGDVAVDIGSQQ